MRILLIVCFLVASNSIYSQSDSVLKVRLVKAERLPPYCGVFAWALTQKFEVVESNVPAIKQQLQVLLNQPCPREAGLDFFITNHLYKVKISSKSGAPFEYSLINEYSKENLLVYWIQKIEQIPE